MFSSFPHSLVRQVTILLLLTTSHALFLPTLVVNITQIMRKAVVQQNLDVAPPFPILLVGLEHMMGQIDANATKAENDSLSGIALERIQSSKPTSLQVQDSAAQCGPGVPCSDGSCCNSEGNCGFTPSNCHNTTATTCISNCDATAMCGVDSLNGTQKCPLNLCCSFLGYCGTSDLYCVNADPTGLTLPCQQGYGDCQVVSPPSCNASDKTTTNGRKVAYWQSGNVRYRSCERIDPSHIHTDGLTHLNFAFASIDPTGFNITPVDPGDFALYSQFTALKSAVMQTWIAIGGFDFSDPGPTYTTWSDMISTSANRASFISSLINFMTTWGFQGVNIDWEYPAIPDRGGRPGDTQNLVSLLADMRAEFGAKYGISVTLPPDFYYLEGFDPISMECYVDFFNFMAYDLHGPWEASDLGAFVRSQSSILDIESDILPLWFDGVDPAKINLGIPYYGRGYTLSNTSCTDIGCPYSGASLPGPCTQSPGVLSLREIDEIIKEKNLTSKLIPDEIVKQISWDNQWMGYDDRDTIAMKNKWGDQHCLGGTAVWSIDFFSGGGSGENPISVSIQGTCGSKYSTTCLGSGFGDCCSEHDWCGFTSAYCSVDNGCQTAFGSCTTEQTTEQISISGDGSCGNGKTCQGSSFGNCCSAYGWCGSSDDYCLGANGCQTAFGSCTAEDLLISGDGSCGNGKTCQGSSFGNCCSGHGWCGSSNDYCLAGNGCQSAFGSCS